MRTKTFDSKIWHTEAMKSKDFTKNARVSILTVEIDDFIIEMFENQVLCGLKYKTTVNAEVGIMNIVKTAYCRIFQQVFHAALPVLPYRKPEILGNVEELSNLLVEKGIGCVMLVTDQMIRSCGLTARLEELLQQRKIRCIVYDKTVANPTTDNVEKALAWYLEEKCEALIGFGGGSSMDCAKAIGARVARPDKQLDKMEGILKVLRPLPLLIAVPTTAGTGSETTLASVIVDSKTRHKYPINDFPLIPRYAVLDPEVTRSLPPTLTATTGMDALTHAVEAYIGRSTTKETRQDAVNAVLLPFVLEAYGQTAFRPLHVLAVAVGISDWRESDEQGARKFIEAVRQMKRDLNIGDTIPDIQKKDIPALARKAEKEANPLYPVPKLMTARQLEEFYYMVMEE